MLSVEFSLQLKWGKKLFSRWKLVMGLKHYHTNFNAIGLPLLKPPDYVPKSFVVRIVLLT